MINHFENLSFTTDFNIDVEELEHTYLAFQKEFHPDNANSADIDRSIAINESYAILKNPITRAAHILQLHNIDLENDEKAPKPEMETLEEILELQEKVADIEPSQSRELQNYLKDKIKTLLQETANEIENASFEKAAQILIRVKYFDKTLKDLKDKKRS